MQRQVGLPQGMNLRTRLPGRTKPRFWSSAFSASNCAWTEVDDGMKPS